MVKIFKYVSLYLELIGIFFIKNNYTIQKKISKDFKKGRRQIHKIFKMLLIYA